MPLHHWPNPRVPWRSFHNHWIVRLVEYLNKGILPPGFQARPTEFIVGIEPDVLLLQEADHPTPNGPRPVLNAATTTAVLPPPAELPIVGIYSAYDTSRLVAAIEIVSPGNKDRPEAVRSFVEKAIFTPLPTLPLFLQTDQRYVMVDLEQTYQETLAAGRYRPT